MSAARRLLLAAMTVAFVASLGACGKKARELDAPDGGKSGYPNSYPATK